MRLAPLPPEVWFGAMNTAAEMRKAKRQIVDFYLASRAAINNWDLVDVSAYRILGAYVYETGERSVCIVLPKKTAFGRSGCLWSLACI